MKIVVGILLGFILMQGCSITDVTDDNEFSPSLSSVVGCWVSTENIQNSYLETLPFSTCKEICFRADSTFTVVINIKESEITKDSIFEAYGKVFPNEPSMWGTDGNGWKSELWLANGHPLRTGGYNSQLLVASASSSIEIKKTSKNTIRDMEPDISWYFQDNSYYFYWNSSQRIYYSSQESGTCGNFGRLIDTDLYTIDSLIVKE